MFSEYSGLQMHTKFIVGEDKHSPTFATHFRGSQATHRPAWVLKIWPGKKTSMAHLMPLGSDGYKPPTGQTELRPQLVGRHPYLPDHDPWFCLEEFGVWKAVECFKHYYLMSQTSRYIEDSGTECDFDKMWVAHSRRRRRREDFSMLLRSTILLLFWLRKCLAFAFI